MVGHFPNPATGRFTLRYTAQAPGKVKVTITDVLSRPVTSKDWRVQAGVNEMSVQTGGMPHGQYVIVVQEGPKRVLKRLSVQ